MAGEAPSSSGSKHPVLSKNVKLFNCGIFSGLIQAAVFNPWDRALYLSVSNHRPFLRMENFKHPMAGVMQTITQRAVSSGLYFPLEDIFAEALMKHSRKRDQAHSARTINFVAGLLAGATNGFFLNPFSSVKVSLFSVILQLQVILTHGLSIATLHSFTTGEGRIAARRAF